MCNKTYSKHTEINCYQKKNRLQLLISGLNSVGQLHILTPCLITATYVYRIKYAIYTVQL